MTLNLTPSADGANDMLSMVQLSTGMWSVRNMDGDRVGYFAFRSDAVEALAYASYDLGSRGHNYDGSSWHKVAMLDRCPGDRSE